MSTPRPSLRKAGDDHVHPSAPRADDIQVSLGGTTADSITSGDPGKPVTLEVKIPKSLRKALKAEAKRRDLTLDEIVIEALHHRNHR